MPGHGYVPVIEITQENFLKLWPALSKAIINASFIAIDCELSGLGDRSNLKCSEIDIRYQNSREVAQKYAIVSLGISCFLCQSCTDVSVPPNGSKDSTENVKSHNYMVQTFNIFTLCTSNYVVDCDSLKFLVSHGFNFNKQYSQGLPYDRQHAEIGKEKNCSSQLLSSTTPMIRDIFHLLIKYSKLLVLHNGFLDLLFLYQSFYANLPKNLETFSSDLFEMFKDGGVFDTKYISEFHYSLPATFLEYVFKKLQLENDVRSMNGLWHCNITFPPYEKKSTCNLLWHYYLVPSENVVQTENARALCRSFKFHGWCPNFSHCELSHDIDRVVWELEPLTFRSSNKSKSSSAAASWSVGQIINSRKHKLEDVNSETKSKRSNINGNGSACYSINGKPDGNSLERTDGKCDSGAVNNGYNQTNHTGDVVGNTDIDLLKGKSHKMLVNNYCCTSPNISQSGLNNSVSNDYHSNSVKRRGKLSNPDTIIKTISDDININNPDLISKKDDNKKLRSGHTAGYDAFMTGYIFACSISSLGRLSKPDDFKSVDSLNLKEIVGKIYLIGKDFPFLLRKSSYGYSSSSSDKLLQCLRPLK